MVAAYWSLLVPELRLPSSRSVPAPSLRLVVADLCLMRSPAPLTIFNTH